MLAQQKHGGKERERDAEVMNTKTRENMQMKGSAARHTPYVLYEDMTGRFACSSKTCQSKSSHRRELYLPHSFSSEH